MWHTCVRHACMSAGCYTQPGHPCIRGTSNEVIPASSAAAPHQHLPGAHAAAALLHCPWCLAVITHLTLPLCPPPCRPHQPPCQRLCARLLLQPWRALLQRQGAGLRQPRRPQAHHPRRGRQLRRPRHHPRHHHLHRGALRAWRHRQLWRLWRRRWVPAVCCPCSPLLLLAVCHPAMSVGALPPECDAVSVTTKAWCGIAYRAIL